MSLCVTWAVELYWPSFFTTTTASHVYGDRRVLFSTNTGLAWPRHAHASTYVVREVQVAVVVAMAVMEVGNLLTKHKGWLPSAFKRCT